MNAVFESLSRTPFGGGVALGGVSDSTPDEPARWRVVVDGLVVYRGSEIGAREAYDAALRLADAFVVELIEPEGQ